MVSYAEMTPDQQSMVKDYHKKSRLPAPTVRTEVVNGKEVNIFQTPNQTVTISPIPTPNPRTGCMVVEVFFDVGDTPKLRAAVYLGTNQSTEYTVRDPDSCWLVDLPEGIFTERESIRKAIDNFLKEGGGKPPGPPDW